MFDCPILVHESFDCTGMNSSWFKGSVHPTEVYRESWIFKLQNNENRKTLEQEDVFYGLIYDNEHENFFAVNRHFTLNQ